MGKKSQLGKERRREKRREEGLATAASPSSAAVGSADAAAAEKKRKKKEKKDKKDKKKEKKDKKKRAGAPAGAEAAARPVKRAKHEAAATAAGSLDAVTVLGPALAGALAAHPAYARPTAVQTACWPAAAAGQDVIGVAPTGAGKDCQPRGVSAGIRCSPGKNAAL